jgi:hypothetical protein
MTDLNGYVQSQRETGAYQSEGVFTVAPELARRKLAESVPEKFACGWSALGFLTTALRLAGLRPAGKFGEPTGIDIIRKVPFGSEGVTVGLALRYEAEQNDWSLGAKEIRQKLIESCERPFGETTPIGLCLSRTILVLSKLKLSVCFQFLGSEQKDFLVSNDSEFKFDEKTLREARCGVKVGVVTVIQGTPDWDEALHDGYTSHSRIALRLAQRDPLRIFTRLQERARAKVPRLFGLKLEHESVWTNAPAREIMAVGFCRISGGWFDYRCKEAALAEMFIASSEVTPLVLNSTCATPESGDEIQRPGDLMTSWERFRSKAEKLVLRWWDTRPSLQHGSLHARAVFAVGLSEAPSRVAFLNWGETKEHIVLDCPPGLGGFVYWPELKQSLYGDSWVRDEAFHEALEWTNKQAKKIFDTLSKEFDYVWEMLARDHVRRSYRLEVERKLRSWLRPESH